MTRNIWEASISSASLRRSNPTVLIFFFNEGFLKLNTAAIYGIYMWDFPSEHKAHVATGQNTARISRALIPKRTFIGLHFWRTEKKCEKKPDLKSYAEVNERQHTCSHLQNRS